MRGEGIEPVTMRAIAEEANAPLATAHIASAIKTSSFCGQHAMPYPKAPDHIAQFFMMIDALLIKAGV